MKKIPVGILGATGMVGQHYVTLLANHPWFEVTYLAASSQSSGKSYAQAIHGRWHQKNPPPEQYMNLPVHALPANDEAIQSLHSQCRWVFSALDTATAMHYEEPFARNGFPLFSNASTHRNAPDVPVLIPEINAHHLKIISLQQKQRGWDKGFLVVKPNCSLQSYLTPLFALHQHFPIAKVILTTLQAVSGAGYPGVASFDIIDNVIPYIAGEEEKTEREPLKILGTVTESGINPLAGLHIAAHCTRVPVLDGHLACVSVGFADNVPTERDVVHLWRNFRGAPQELALPSAPKQPIVYRPELDRPQPRLDRDHDNGMAVTVGRLRSCPVLDLRFVGLSHNTVRGAAGGGILNAELVKAWLK